MGPFRNPVPHPASCRCLVAQPVPGQTVEFWSGYGSGLPAGPNGNTRQPKASVVGPAGQDGRFPRPERASNCVRQERNPEMRSDRRRRTPANHSPAEAFRGAGCRRGRGRYRGRSSTRKRRRQGKAQVRSVGRADGAGKARPKYGPSDAQTATGGNPRGFRSPQAPATGQGHRVRGRMTVPVRDRDFAFEAEQPLPWSLSQAGMPGREPRGTRLDPASRRRTNGGRQSKPQALPAERVHRTPGGATGMSQDRGVDVAPHHASTPGAGKGQR